MPTQQQKPIRIGFPPDFTSLMILVLRPIAAIAITIKNLLIVLKGENALSGTPNDVAIVVISEAAMKKRIKNGKIFFMLIAAPPVLFSFLVRTKANTSVIGIIASVRVSFTTVAVSSVLLPCIPSHAAAAAVTEEVSLTAVPANKPKP